MTSLTPSLPSCDRARRATAACLGSPAGGPARIASIFFLSGRTKVSGLLTITDSAYYLFETDYRLPFLSPHVAAHIATYSEHLFPISGPWPRHALPRCRSGHDHGDRGFRLSDAWPTHLSWAGLLLP
jgi:putative oxidoreductase